MHYLHLSTPDTHHPSYYCYTVVIAAAEKSRLVIHSNVSRGQALWIQAKPRHYHKYKSPDRGLRCYNGLSSFHVDLKRSIQLMSGHDLSHVKLFVTMWSVLLWVVWCAWSRVMFYTGANAITHPYGPHVLFRDGYVLLSLPYGITSSGLCQFIWTVWIISPIIRGLLRKCVLKIALRVHCDEQYSANVCISVSYPSFHSYEWRVPLILQVGRGGMSISSLRISWV